MLHSLWGKIARKKYQFSKTLLFLRRLLHARQPNVPEMLTEKFPAKLCLDARVLKRLKQKVHSSLNINGLLVTFLQILCKIDDNHFHLYVMSIQILRCIVCDEVVGDGPGLRDLRCIWCQATVHTECLEQAPERCNYGKHK